MKIQKVAKQSFFRNLIKKFSLSVSSPKAFLRWKAQVMPFLGGITLLLALLGLWFSFWGSPLEVRQSTAVRMMYVHVPASWFAMGIYVFMAVGAGIGFIWRHPLADLTCKAAAPIGLCFTAISLITGSLWGRPMWGSWWVWDARLTSVLVLFFLYLGYMVFLGSFEDPGRGLRLGRVLLFLGLINIPIIKWSVTWWNTLHQPASIAPFSGVAIHGDFLVPLGWMTLTFGGVFLILLLQRLELEILVRRWRSLLLMQG